MKPVARVFFVTDAEYPKLQAACPGDFPFSYIEFVKRIEEGTEVLGDSARVVRVVVDVAEFLAWCSERKRHPDSRARAEYAAAAGAKSDLN